MRPRHSRDILGPTVAKLLEGVGLVIQPLSDVLVLAVTFFGWAVPQYEPSPYGSRGHQGGDTGPPSRARTRAVFNLL